MRTPVLVLAALLAACSGSSGSGSRNPPASSEPDLAVTPSTPFASSGFEGGPFAPGSTSYVLENVGAGTLAWSAEATEPWLTVAPASGTLDAAETETVTVSVDPLVAAALAPGLYTGSADFVNDTNGAGTTSRGVVLEVERVPGGTMTVEPPGEFRSVGPLGGPFQPGSMDYTVRNDTAGPIDWTATTTTPEIQAAPAGGTLQPQESVVVAVSLDQTAAAQLGLGTYTEAVFFVDQTNGDSESRPVTLEVRSGGGPTLASELTQFGLVWTFDGDHPVGQFANGDWWVVGPVTITKIHPPSTSGAGRVANGSMINPSPRNGMTQGYDSTMYAQYRSPGDYQNALNVGLDVSPANPLVVPPGSSLVSTVSQIGAAVRPQLLTAAVLTVLDAPAPDGSFRPPYAGSDKTIRFHESQLDYTRLAALAPVASTPSVDFLEASFRRPWIDHVPLWPGRYLHPVESMPDYGRELVDRVGIASLVLNIDLPDADKRDLLVGLVQLGIDFWGIAQDGGRNNWPPSAGHMSGRKWPILFAGIVLGDPDMGSVGFDPSIQFGEDGQTFYVEETSPGIYNLGYGGYGPQHVGMPEWGTAHANRPSLDDVDWFGDPYRHCCTANAWWGQLLSAYAMGAKGLWNHDALFDYQDRYLATNLAFGITDWRLAWSQFALDMWSAYRNDY